jgi:hypothetical protein
MILAALTVFIYYTDNNAPLQPPEPDNVDYSEGDRRYYINKLLNFFDLICWLSQRLFDIFWYHQNLPLIPLAIDFNQSKSQKII